MFDLAFLDEKEVVLVLQGFNDGEYYVVNGILDFNAKLLQIDTPVSATHMQGLK